ncbi:hypothetical protein Rhopal_004591-T1 [Rhodotorula paludigena]|uniref:Uncharacterized protein n=1 Tax=Rhodotorula paludigena TaxID=86838 RepID=A0AAV5GSC3_9BASI|nr:hypothetical protein Rhopal_004591-T1 [Rhodotorula paludigena]
MKFAGLAVFSLASIAAAAPAKRQQEVKNVPAYIGTLVAPSAGFSVPLGGSFDLAYDTSHEYQPHYGASIRSVDIGIQGPTPIIPVDNSFQPYGIQEIKTGLPTDGPGAWVNETITIPSQINKAGQYFLIIQEHQTAVYDSEQPLWRVQSYNVSFEITEASS